MGQARAASKTHHSSFALAAREHKVRKRKAADLNGCDYRSFAFSVFFCGHHKIEGCLMAEPTEGEYLAVS